MSTARAGKSRSLDIPVPLIDIRNCRWAQDIVQKDQAKYVAAPATVDTFGEEDSEDAGEDGSS